MIGFKDQKNWSPFDLDGRLVFSYSLFPHVVVEPVDHVSVITDLNECFLVLSDMQASLNAGVYLQSEFMFLRE